MNVLKESESLIYGDREKDYGHPQINFKNIARLWTAYLTNLGTTNLLGKDVAMMMQLLKMARAQMSSTPVRDHKDNVVDMAGYVGLLERLEESNFTYSYKATPNELLYTPIKLKVSYNSPGGVSQVETVNPSHPQTVNEVE